VGRVGNRYVWQGGQTENQGGQTKFFRRFAPNFAHPGLKPCRRPCDDDMHSSSHFKGERVGTPFPVLKCLGTRENCAVKRRRSFCLSGSSSVYTQYSTQSFPVHNVHFKIINMIVTSVCMYSQQENEPMLFSVGATPWNLLRELAALPWTLVDWGRTIPSFPTSSIASASRFSIPTKEAFPLFLFYEMTDYIL